MTTCSPPATTLSLADVVHRRDTCLPLQLRPPLIRWRSAPVMARVQVEGLQRLQRLQGTQAPAATARDRPTTEEPLDKGKGRPWPPFPFQQTIQYTAMPAYPTTPHGKKTHLRCRGREVYPTEGSCRFPLIVLQQTTQSFLATHNSVLPARSSIRQWEQEPVLLALVIALRVVMCHVLLQGSAQRVLPEQDEFRQAFLFHRSHPAFCKGVQIRTPGW